eukprot:CCRYP_004548-RA/>CCRYP_004548-RA protein AED:0.12 eAED:0.22 QI:0/0.6/0/1/1/1/6/0/1916
MISDNEFDFECDDDDDSTLDEESDISSYVEENIHPNKKKAAPVKSSKKNETAKPKASTNKAKSAGKTIEETYQKKTQLEHILLRPDTYIGSTEPLTQPMFVLDSTTERIVQREITYTPGLYKIFDEIVVNAADNKQRDPKMDRLEVHIDAGEGTISVLNNGKGIPIALHKEHGCYVPTLIFGHLLTGSNFDDNEKKTTGGRNGYGAKLANIFSKEFIVECVDSKERLKFKQVFRDNMHTAEEPKIKACSVSEEKKGDYVKISFKPDLERFNMTHLDEDTISLLSKRAYDIAGSMANKDGKKLNVYLNDKKIPVKDFKTYLALFDGISPPAAYEKVGDRWEVGVSASDGSFQQISFVNAIATTKGGGHVDFISDQIAKSLQVAVKKKNKGGTEIKAKQIKNHLSVFVNCLVENPTFDSQTKENLTTRPSAFKSEVKLSDMFLKQVEKCGIVDAIVAYGKFKEKQSLQRKNGTKKSKLTGITKLDDANFAGTAKSKDCTLIITEGDSAKSLAVSGLSVVGRDYYGVFPLKGKPLNVRDSTHAQVMKNEEIMNLVEIMGFKFGATYTEENIKSLRYGHLMIMADQDHDGSHIKGLIINFIHHFWPSLLDVPDFLLQFITPIVKCTKGNKTHTFFTLPEYEEWKESTGNSAKGWTIKYYKGLGTSTSSEAKEYFSNLDIHEIRFNELSSDVITFDNEGMDESVPEEITSGASLIDMAFSKSKVEARKRWLNNIEKNTFLNYSKAQKNGVNYSEFINRELVLFSQYDNVRSIPHVMDGFKPSQRKVLFACFKKKLKSEIKVAQLAGYIGEHSAYHHGDMSLNGAIIGMAQSYCGSNNVNLLYPSGQFGTRRMGGKDHASARYIFTRLEKIARAIFHPDDDALLNYLNDDGLSIEPEYYVPVIPMVLVNGSEGIGTGYSSTIQNHSPRDIIANIRRMLHGQEPEMMHPYFTGFSGEIFAERGKKEGSYTVKGKIERKDDTTLLITELPIGKWTQDYKAFLEAMVSGNDKNTGEISDFKENHTDTTVSFTVSAPKENIDAFEKVKDGLYSKFKLSTTISTKNMTAFDVNGKLHRYATCLDILRVFFHHRLEYYAKRKELLLEKLRKELNILDNKARFVEEVCKGDLIVSNRKRAELLADLKEKGYDLFPKEEKKTDEDDEDSEGEGEKEDATDDELAKGYEYLLGMKIWSLTFEKAEELRMELAKKKVEANKLEITAPESIWLNDLGTIEEALNERDVQVDAEATKESQAQSKARVRNTKKAATAARNAKKSKKRKDEWESDFEDSDEDEDFVSSKTKPAPRKKSPPKKQLNSLGSNNHQSKNVKSTEHVQNRVLIQLSNDLSQVMVDMPKRTSPDELHTKVKTSKKAAPSARTNVACWEMKATSANRTKKASKSLCELSDDEDFDDIVDDDDSSISSDNEMIVQATGEDATTGRSRRVCQQISYAVDESSEAESEIVSEEESDEQMLVEHFHFFRQLNLSFGDFDEDDHFVSSKSKLAPRREISPKKQQSIGNSGSLSNNQLNREARLAEPKQSRASKHLLVDDDDDSQSEVIGHVSRRKLPDESHSEMSRNKKTSPTNHSNIASSKKKATAAKHANKASKSVCELSEDDDVNDVLDDDDSSIGSNKRTDATTGRRRRVSQQLSYAVDESSEAESEVASEEETTGEWMLEPETNTKPSAKNTVEKVNLSTSATKYNKMDEASDAAESSITDALVSVFSCSSTQTFLFCPQWNLNFEDSDEVEDFFGSRTKHASRKRSPQKKQRMSHGAPGIRPHASSRKKAKSLIPESSRVFKTICINDDANPNDVSVTIASKRSSKANSKKNMPKKKSPRAAKTKLTVSKKKATEIKPIKRPSKSVCDLSSDDEEDVYEFPDDFSVQSEGSDDIVTNVTKSKSRNSRRSRSKVSYADESSDDVFNEDSDVE